MCDTPRFTGACHFAAFLSEAGMIPESAAAIEGPALLEEFNNWMRSHRGITEETLDRYSPIIECLLRALGEEVECYDAKKLRDFVLNLAKRYALLPQRMSPLPCGCFFGFSLRRSGVESGWKHAFLQFPLTVVCRTTCLSMPLSESSQLVLKQRR